MPRSSGQNAMPMRAILSEEARMMSWPSKRIEPVRLPMMPMTDFSVVVLPAPLRPSSVTTSPGVHVEIDAVQDVGFAVPGFEILRPTASARRRPDVRCGGVGHFQHQP